MASKKHTYELIGAKPGSRLPDAGPSEVVFGADALTVFECMRERAPFMAGDNVEAYMQELCANLLQYHGVRIELDRSIPVERQADMLLDALLDAGFLRRAT